MATAQDPVLVHDYLLVMRGAERTFAAMADVLAARRRSTRCSTTRRAPGGASPGRRVSHLAAAAARASPQDSFRRLLPLYPPAAERLPVARPRRASSRAPARSRTASGPTRARVHVCYCHSPFRYAWHERERALREVPAPAAPGADARCSTAIRALGPGRQRGASTHYVANSEITRERIARLLRAATRSIVHPPVEVDRFRTGEPEDWFLVGQRGRRATSASRSPSRPPAAPARRSRSSAPGPDLERLRARVRRARAEFLGRVSDEELRRPLRRAPARWSMPNVEEFGIAARRGAGRRPPGAGRRRRRRARDRRRGRDRPPRAGPTTSTRWPRRWPRRPRPPRSGGAVPEVVSSIDRAMVHRGAGAAEFL